MKAKYVIIALLAVAALYLLFRPQKQDPHYYAAACVMINDMGQPASPEQFLAKLREVIINENASYAFDKVEFNRHSAQGASQRYYALTPDQQKKTGQGLDACLAIMLPETLRK